MSQTETKQAFLLSCWHEIYCQGTEETFGYFLVYARDLETAKNILRCRLEGVRDINNCTFS